MTGTRAIKIRPLASAEDLAGVLARLEAEDAASLELLDPVACAFLADAARALDMRDGLPVIGEGADAVFQDFRLTAAIPDDHPVRDLTRRVGALTNRALDLMDPRPLPGRFAINDLIVQLYPKGSAGITAHRDHLRYTGLVLIVVVEGDGRFLVSSDRAGSDAREVAAAAGRMTVMRAPGFGGRRDRPFHAVTDVRGPRICIGLRHDSRPLSWHEERRRAAAGGAGD